MDAGRTQVASGTSTVLAVGPGTKGERGEERRGRGRGEAGEREGRGRGEDEEREGRERRGGNNERRRGSNFYVGPISKINSVTGALKLL